jgi:hypothetical protein
MSQAGAGSFCLLRALSGEYNLAANRWKADPKVERFQDQTLHTTTGGPTLASLKPAIKED